jgi:hypothetical protein
MREKNEQREDAEFDRQVQQIQSSTGHTDDQVVRVCRRTLFYACPTMIVIAIVASIIGLVTSENMSGLWAALCATALDVWFCLSTPACFLILSRHSWKGDSSAAFSRFIGVAMSFEIIKLAITAVILWLLGQENWFDPAVFGWTVLAGIIGSLTSLIIGTVRKQ